MSWQYASSSIEPRHFGQVFGELVAALNERAQAIGAHWTTNGDIAYRPTYYVPSIDSLPVAAAGQQIPWTITGEPEPPEVPDVMSVTAYIAWRDYVLRYYSDLEEDRIIYNHNGHPYTGGPQAWTLARMLEYLGETEIEFPEASQWRCDWLEQQYRLINLMRHLRSMPGADAAVKDEPWYPYTLGTWAELVDHFEDDLTWNPGGFGAGYGVRHWALSYDAVEGHQINRLRNIVDPASTGPGAGVAWKSALSYDVWFNSVLAPIGDITVERYEDNDYGTSAFQGWFAFVSGVAAGNTDWFSWGDIDTVSISQPATQEAYYGYNWSGPLYVFHPTFTYQDWS